MNRSLSTVLTGTALLLAACTESETVTSPSRNLTVREAKGVAAASYSATNLGTISGYDETIGFEVNDAGTVVIQATYLPAAGPRIAKWYMKTGSVIHLLDSGGIRGISGGAVHVVGFRSTGVRWTYSTTSGFSAATATPGYGYAVNDAGDALGDSPDGAAIWNADGSVTSIPNPSPSLYSGVEPADINSSRDAAITWWGGSGRPDRGFVTTADGTMIELMPLAGQRSTYVRGVSDRIGGKIYAGGTSDDDNGKFNAVRWTIDLATHAVTAVEIGSAGTNGLGMSDDGTLAGNITGANPSGFVMKPNGPITSLSTPKGAGSGRVWGISGNGRYISGDAKVGNYRRAILWTAQ